MILSCSWAGTSASNIFATGGRDKNVKIWGVQASETVTADLHLTIPLSASATSVAFYTSALSTPATVVLAAGTETGDIGVWCISTEDWSVKAEVKIDSDMRPSGAINALRWRPDGKTEEAGQRKMQLAVASEDLSVRLFELAGLI
jgi:elongator complex protein 2